jgi:hypothetical protein
MEGQTTKGNRKMKRNRKIKQNGKGRKSAKRILNDLTPKNDARGGLGLMSQRKETPILPP